MCMSDYRRGLDWWLDLLTTWIHHSELHFTDHWHTQTSILSLLQSPIAVFWQRLLPREILQLPWSRRCPLVNTPHLNSQFQLSTNCSFGTPELDWTFSTELFFTTTLYGPNRKHCFQKYFYCYRRVYRSVASKRVAQPRFSIVACIYVDEMTRCELSILWVHTSHYRFGNCFCFRLQDMKENIFFRPPKDPTE
jgi:hypothetical protein